ncbi:MAG: hypothetical protein WKF75_01735 [Singulisphaera sp.]
MPDMSTAELTQEYLARLAHEKDGLKSVVPPFSGYGEDQDDTSRSRALQAGDRTRTGRG